MKGDIPITVLYQRTLTCYSPAQPFASTLLSLHMVGNRTHSICYLRNTIYQLLIYVKLKHVRLQNNLFTLGNQSSACYF